MALNMALKIHENDNVAVIFSKPLLPGMDVEVRDEDGHAETVTLLSAIPYGHKIAIRDIPGGTPILKYGEQIGRANGDIARGEHVHVHNLDCQRGRGDLHKTGRG